MESGLYCAAFFMRLPWGDIGDPTKKIVFDYLSKLFNDRQNTAEIQFLDDSGGYDNGQVSLSELELMGGLMENLSMGMLVHEISEQWYKQVVLALPRITAEGNPQYGNDNGYLEAHSYALTKESTVTGYTRTGIRMDGGTEHHYFYKNGKFEKGFMIGNDLGKTITKIKTANKNIQNIENMKRQYEGAESYRKKVNFSSAEY
jgi:hypothetical protein